MKPGSLPTRSSLMLLGLVALLALPPVAAAQSADSLDERGRSVLTVGVGLTGTRTNVVSGSRATARAAGEVASLAFTHFIRPSVAIELSTHLLNASTSAAAGSAHDEAVMPFLFGVSASPAKLALGAALRPFVSVAAGPYVRMITEASGPTGANSTESALGAKFGIGADWHMARHAALRLAGDYHAVGDFAERSGAVTKNASGFALSLGLGFAWGR